MNKSLTLEAASTAPLEAYSVSMDLAYRPELKERLKMAHFTCSAGFGHRITHDIFSSYICLSVLRDLPYH